MRQDRRLAQKAAWRSWRQRWPAGKVRLFSPIQETAMPEPEQPKQSKIVSVCVIICVVIGIVGFQAAAPHFFPSPPGGGFNWERILWAAIVGGGSAVIGLALGRGIEMLTKK